MTLINNMTNSRRMYDVSEAFKVMTASEMLEQDTQLAEEVESLKTATPDLRRKLDTLQRQMGGENLTRPDISRVEKARDAQKSLDQLRLAVSLDTNLRTAFNEELKNRKEQEEIIERVAEAAGKTPAQMKLFKVSNPEEYAEYLKQLGIANPDQANTTSESNPQPQANESEVEKGKLAKIRDGITNWWTNRPGWVGGKGEQFEDDDEEEPLVNLSGPTSGQPSTSSQPSQPSLIESQAKALADQFDQFSDIIEANENATVQEQSVLTQLQQAMKIKAQSIANSQVSAGGIKGSEKAKLTQELLDDMLSELSEVESLGVVDSELFNDELKLLNRKLLAATKARNADLVKSVKAEIASHNSAFRKEIIELDNIKSARYATLIKQYNLDILPNP
jgi:hypothetical protein